MKHEEYVSMARNDILSRESELDEIEDALMDTGQVRLATCLHNLRDGMEVTESTIFLLAWYIRKTDGGWR